MLKTKPMMTVDSGAMGDTCAIASISTPVASLPLDDTNVPGWTADLGSGLLAVPLVLNMLLLNLLSVALFLSLETKQELLVAEFALNPKSLKRKGLYVISPLGCSFGSQ